MERHYAEGQIHWRQQTLEYDMMRDYRWAETGAVGVYPPCQEHSASGRTSSYLGGGWHQAGGEGQADEEGCSQACLRQASQETVKTEPTSEAENILVSDV